MDGFTFYKSFYETLKKIRKKADRAQAVLAVVEFMFEDEEPQGLSEVGEIAFESFRHTLTKAKNNSGRGGRPKMENGFNQEEKNKNRIETELKPNKNRIETETETSSSYSSSSSSSTTPLLSPQGADGRSDVDKAQEEFFALYPKISIDNYSPSEYSGIDFELLIRRFEESKFLRETQSFAWVCKHYPTIAAGDYKDFDKRVSRQSANDMGYNGMAFFDEITENLKAREVKTNDG